MKKPKLKIIFPVVFLMLGIMFLIPQTNKILLSSFFTTNIIHGYILPIKPAILDSVSQFRKKEYNKIYFVGDIMLGRHVEFLMSKHGSKYPYEKLEFDMEDSYLIGNFEASIPKIHKRTPNFNFNFSVEEKYIPDLKSIGFTHLSLANNHSFDFGDDDFQNTKSVLMKNDLIPMGHPNFLASSSTEFLEVSGIKVSIIPIHTLSGYPSGMVIKNVMEQASNKSDLQIAYIHWGSEYVSIPSKADREFARSLIDSGVDLILGHHPHIVQNIEEINGVPVVYSLGNFIFDQYFSSSVRDGLMVGVTIEDDVELELIPVTSRHSLAQTQLMNDEEKKVFLNNLSDNSVISLKEDIRSGRIVITNKLATSTKTAIMAE